MKNNHSNTIQGIALESRDAVELLADKWRIAILHVLTTDARRTRDLQNAIEDIAPKVLTQTLRGMERDGLIVRRALPVARRHVEYELTAMGRDVLAPLRELCRWAKAHADERDVARSKFDAEQAISSTLGRRSASKRS